MSLYTPPRSLASAIWGTIVQPGDDIQAAVDALGGRGTVMLAAGDFILPTTVDLDGEIDFRGAGMGATRLFHYGSGPAIQENSGRGVTTSRWSISDLALIGGGLGEYGVIVGQPDDSPLSAHHGGMENCLITGFTNTGLVLQYSQANYFSHLSIIENGVHGIVVDSPDGHGNTATTFDGCIVRENGECGLYGVNGVHISFQDVLFERNGHEGAWLHNDTVGDARVNWYFVRCHFEHGNDGRAGVGHAQFEVSNDGAGFWENLSVEHPYLWGAGAGNTHMRVGAVKGQVIWPRAMSPQELGTDTEGSCNLLITHWRDTPAWWTLRDGASTVAWEVGSGVLRKRYVNDGAGGWV